MNSQSTSELFGKSVFNTSTMRKYLSRDQYSKIKRIIENNLEFDDELASKVDLNPPEGNEDASDSPINSAS